MRSLLKVDEMEEDCLSKMWLPLEDIQEVIYNGCHSEIEVSVLALSNMDDETHTNYRPRRQPLEILEKVFDRTIMKVNVKHLQKNFEQRK